MADKKLSRYQRLTQKYQDGKKIRIPDVGRYSLDEIRTLEDTSGIREGMRKKGALGLTPKFNWQGRLDHFGESIKVGREKDLVETALKENYQKRFETNLGDAFPDGVPTGLSPDSGYNLEITNQRELNDFSKYREENPDATLRDFKMDRFYTNRKWAEVPEDQRGDVFDIYQSGLSEGDKTAASRAWNSWERPEPPAREPVAYKIPPVREYKAAYRHVDEMAADMGVSSDDLMHDFQNMDELDRSQRVGINLGNAATYSDAIIGMLPNDQQYLKDGIYVGVSGNWDASGPKHHGPGSWNQIGGKKDAFAGYTARNSIDKIAQIVDNNNPNVTSALDIVNKNIVEYQEKGFDEFMNTEVNFNFDTSYDREIGSRQQDSNHRTRSGFANINSIFNLIEKGGIYNLDRLENAIPDKKYLDDINRNSETDEISNASLSQIENKDIKNVTHVGDDGQLMNTRGFLDKDAAPSKAIQYRQDKANNLQLLASARIANQVADKFMMDYFGTTKHGAGSLSKEQIKKAQEKIAIDTEGMGHEQKKDYYKDLAFTMIRGFTYNAHKRVPYGEQSPSPIQGKSGAMYYITNLIDSVIGKEHGIGDWWRDSGYKLRNRKLRREGIDPSTMKPFEQSGLTDKTD